MRERATAKQVKSAAPPKALNGLFKTSVAKEEPPRRQRNGSLEQQKENENRSKSAISGVSRNDPRVETKALSFKKPVRPRKTVVVQKPLDDINERRSVTPNATTNKRIVRPESMSTKKEEAYVAPQVPSPKKLSEASNNSLSVLLKKKTEESMRLNQQM